jgi:serine/threonine-protein kinase
LAPPRRRTIRLGLPAALAAALVAFGIWRGTRGPAAMPRPADAPPEVATTPATPPPEAPEAPTSSEPSEPAPTPREHARRTPKPGKVVFRVYPWAEVFYRGKSLGVTPIAPVETPAGVQTFVLRNTELAQEKEVRIQVSPGAVSTYKLDFLKR